MKAPSPAQLAQAAQKLAFYEWAYGRLGENDDGLGPLGEFVVGLRVGGVDGHRREKAPVDLVGTDGTTYEVKTTGRPKVDGVHRPRHTWTIRDEADALEGRAPLADRWVFLRTDFPPRAAWSRLFNVFDARGWAVYVLTGEEMRDLGVRGLVTDGTFRRAEIEPLSLDVLGPAPASHPLLLRLRFFMWAYGDLSTPFNFGRLAEFQVMRVCGMPTASRKSWGAVDLRARDGRTLEVKTTTRLQHDAAGRAFREFAIPARRAAPRAGSGKTRVADYFVFAWAQEKDGGIPMEPGRWRFMLVPTAALANRYSVRTTTLARMGYPVLSASQLRAALTRENTDESRERRTIG